MKLHRRSFTALGLALPLLFAGCAATHPSVDPAARAALAPTGTLRVGVYPGSPTSLVKDVRTGAPAGVAHDLGLALGGRLGVPVKIVEFARAAEVLDALKAGQVDFTFTNATEVRARDMDFTEPLVLLELGYLVPPGSAIKAIADVDRPGVRVGVAQGSSSQGTLGRQYRNAAIVSATSLSHAKEMFQSRSIDAFATNKGILFEMSDGLSQYRVLDGRWGEEHIAIAIPKGRQQGMPLLREFAQEMKSNGRLQAMVERAGLRGTARE
jgi:polar amino acid transport system substrate-binding protein